MALVRTKLAPARPARLVEVELAASRAARADELRRSEVDMVIVGWRISSEET